MYNTKGLNMREESFLVVSHNNINLRVSGYFTATALCNLTPFSSKYR